MTPEFLSKVAEIQQEVAPNPPVDVRAGLLLWTMDEGHILTFQPQPDIKPIEIAMLLPVLFTMTHRPIDGITEWLAGTGLARHWSRTKVEQS